MQRLTRRKLLARGTTAGIVAATAGLAGIESIPLPRRERPVDLKVRASPIVGFAAGSAYTYANATDQSRMLDVITAGRATGIRFDIPWYFAQPTATTYNWGFLDTLVGNADGRGMFILGTISTCPPWAAAASDGYQYNRPRSATEYANFCAAVATRYNGKIDAYEIWNEPNGRLFFSPDPDAAFYTSMVKAAYPRIKAVNSGVSVVAGAIGETANIDGQIDGNQFLNAMYANGIAGYCDAISFHPYDFSATFAAGMLYDNAPIRQMIRMHSTMKANGDGAKKIWPTEYGAPTIGGLTQAMQNDLISNSLRQWREVSYAGPMFIYSVRDSQTGSSDAQANFGVATTAYAPKQALYGLEQLGRLGYPKRNEQVVFEQNADPALGSPVGPVFQISHGYGYECENGTRYLTNNGIFSSPTDVATVARHFQVVPLAAFANGMQDMDVTGGFRIFSRSDTGTHAIFGAILAAWTSRLGFPTTDQYVPAGAPNNVAADFEFGRITFTPTGTSVTPL